MIVGGERPASLASASRYCARHVIYPSPYHDRDAFERAAPALRGTYSDDFRYEAYAEYNLGRTQAELGECKEARKHLKRSEHLQGGREEIDDALALCGKPGKD